MERLRANRTGTGSRRFESSHVVEAVLEPKTYLWIAMTLLLNVGASVTNTFGPLILDGLIDNKRYASLLNMPFGVLQTIVILLASYLAQKAKLKGVVLASFILPVVAGFAVLFAVPRDGHSQPTLLAGYYLLAFLFGGNPLIVSWIVGNTAGTKKSAIMSVYNAASSAGNIIGPLLFHDRDSPEYRPGLRACLAIFLALVAVLMQWANLVFLNRMQEKRRVRNGKNTKVVDSSMQARYGSDGQGGAGDVCFESPSIAPSRPEEKSLHDLTDGKNDEFIYIY